MMGYALATSACFGCNRIFSYNPVRVPSIRVGADGHPSPTGDRKPICFDCVARANVNRVKYGLDPIVPHPEAYIACDESELS